MGFQNFGNFRSRHPAIRTTGLLTFALAGLSPAEHTSVSWSPPPDMLTARRQVIGGTGTYTPLDSQPCRLLPFLACHPLRPRGVRTSLSSRAGMLTSAFTKF